MNGTCVTEFGRHGPDPTAVITAFPDRPVNDEDLFTLAAGLSPTPVFTDQT